MKSKTGIYSLVVSLACLNAFAKEAAVTEQANVAEVGREFATQSEDDSAGAVVFEDDFEQGMDRWFATDTGLQESVWSIAPLGRVREAGHVLRVAGKSNYEPPFRSPHSIALIKDVVVGSFELTVKVQNTSINAGDHRDLCFFWGFQDPAHFYYAHLGAKPDPHSSQIFIVNGAARKMITTNKSQGIPWTDGWHAVKVKYQSESGQMQVYFEDMNTPVFIASDKTFDWGRVGLGTFDDSGNFDNVQLRGEVIQPIPTSAKLP